MACAERWSGIDDTGGKAHHQEGGFDRCVWISGCSRRRGSRRGCGAHEEIAVVGFIQGDGVGLGGREVRVCTGDECAADGDLGGKANDGAGYGGGGEGGYGCVDIARVGGEEGPEEEKDFSRAVGWGVAVGEGKV